MYKDYINAILYMNIFGTEHLFQVNILTSEMVLHSPAMETQNPRVRVVICLSGVSSCIYP
jgi:hypothetical protein